MAKAKAKTKTKVKAETKQETAVQTTADSLREEIPRLLSTVDSTYVEVAQKLSEVFHKGYYKVPYGYDKFDEWCEAELVIKPRKAMYLVEIFDKANMLNLPMERISRIGWTKMKELVAILSKDMPENDIAGWLDFAEENSTSVVINEVKNHRVRTRSDAVAGDIKWHLVMNESEANIITDAVEEAKAITNNENTVVALEYICQDWQERVGNSPSRTTVEDVISHLERVYGIVVGEYRQAGEGRQNAAAVSSDEKKEAAKKKEDPPDPDEDDVESILDDTAGPDDDPSGDSELDELLA
jgi:hypothetical protein